MNTLNRMNCPRCGRVEVSTENYDYGVDRETGYHDAGTIGKCAKCGLEADIEDFSWLKRGLPKTQK